MPERLASMPPEGVEELCLVRMGLQAHRLRAYPRFRSLLKAIDRAAVEAAREGGLLHHERFRIAWNHTGVLQYWKSFDELDRWSHRPPHAEWWRDLTERLRSRRDLGIYHEVYLIPRANVEAIAVQAQPAGLAVFGRRVEATGLQTTARDRLGRRTPISP